MSEINGVSLPFLPVGGVEELKRQQPSPVGPEVQTPFKTIFEQEFQKLKFSAHAQTRLNSRDIALSQEDVQKLESAVAKAEAKGAKESLVLMRDMAFIVSVQNRTVITAVHNEQLKNNVFTNIDSAVIV